MEQGEAEKLFSAQQCWTCRSLIYDVELRKHRCPKTGRTFEKADVAKPTNCEEWNRA